MFYSAAHPQRKIGSHDLVRIGMLATVELDQAKVPHTRVQTDRQAAAALNFAQFELDRSRPTAPFEGWLLRTHTVPGQTIAAGPVTRTVPQYCDLHTAVNIVPTTTGWLPIVSHVMVALP